MSERSEQRDFSAHQRGYDDYMRAGMTARNPYPITRRLDREKWLAGFFKARKDVSQ